MTEHKNLADKKTPFDGNTPHLVEDTSGEVNEIVEFPIKAEGNRAYWIDLRYGDAFQVGLEHLTFDGVCALTLSANRSQSGDDAGVPRLIPTSIEERSHGPEFSFPLGRIIHDCGASQQVERRELKGLRSFHVTVENTFVSGGKASNTHTREAFLAYIKGKAGPLLRRKSVGS